MKRPTASEVIRMPKPRPHPAILRLAEEKLAEWKRFLDEPIDETVAKQ